MEGRTQDANNKHCCVAYCIVEPVFGGLGPATYRSAEAPVDWFQKRGEGYVRRVRITDPTPQAGVVHARDTWQHTTPLHGNSPSPPCNQKPSFWTCVLDRAARARSCRRAAEHRSGVAILAMANFRRITIMRTRDSWRDCERAVHVPHRFARLTPLFPH